MYLGFIRLVDNENVVNGHTSWYKKILAYIICSCRLTKMEILRDLCMHICLLTSCRSSMHTLKLTKKEHCLLTQDNKINVGYL